MKRNILFTFCLFPLLLTAQVKFIRKADTTLTEMSPLSPFYYLEPKIDSTKLLFLGEIDVSSKKSGHNFEILFYRLKREAQKLGANTFLVRKILNEKTGIALTANVYYAGDSSIIENISLKQKNCVYIFSFGDSKSDITIYANSKESKVKQYTGTKYCLNENEVLELKRFDGSKVEFKSNPSSNSVFINLQEVDTNRPVTNVYYVFGKITYYTLSVHHAAGFYQMNPEFGRLLQEIYFSHE